MNIRIKSAALVATATLLLLVGNTAARAADNGGLLTGYGLGAGAGIMNMGGDFIEHRREPVIQAGWDMNSRRLFMIIQSSFATDNTFRSFDFILGGGLPWLKVGTGILSVTGTVPTAGGLNTAPSGSGLTVLTDAGRPTEIENHAVPLYIRLTPWHSHDTVVNVDLWRSLANSGKERIPVNILGGPGYFVSTWSSESAIQGASIRITHRISKHVGINVDYQYMEGRNDHNTLPTVLGPNIAAPVVHWYTAEIVASAQVVF